jgi:hypothetical protein
VVPLGMTATVIPDPDDDDCCCPDLEQAAIDVMTRMTRANAIRSIGVRFI